MRIGRSIMDMRLSVCCILFTGILLAGFQQVSGECEWRVCPNHNRESWLKWEVKFKLAVVTNFYSVIHTDTLLSYSSTTDYYGK